MPSSSRTACTGRSTTRCTSSSWPYSPRCGPCTTRSTRDAPPERRRRTPPMSDYPYAERYTVVRGLPSEGRDRGAILSELREMASGEDAYWETGRCSGTMYCGDHDHYAFMNEAFGMFAHANILQRDMFPSATKLEGEIIAMTLDMLHANAIVDGEAVGMVTTGGSGSILHAMLA